MTVLPTYLAEHDFLKNEIKICDFLFFCVCVILTGCGCSGGGKLHHPLLCPDGLGGLSHSDRNIGDLLPGGPVNWQSSCKEAQTGCFWARLVYDFGLSHQGLLPG